METTGSNVVAGSTSEDLDAAVVADAVKVVHDHADRIFVWNYDRDRDRLVTLYNRAMASQWNSVTELDWSTDVDPEGLVSRDGPFLRLVREAIRDARIAHRHVGRARGPRSWASRASRPTSASSCTASRAP